MPQSTTLGADTGVAAPGPSLAGLRRMFCACPKRLDHDLHLKVAETLRYIARSTPPTVELQAAVEQVLRCALALTREVGGPVISIPEVERRLVAGLMAVENLEKVLARG